MSSSLFTGVLHDSRCVLNSSYVISNMPLYNSDNSYVTSVQQQSVVLELSW